MVAWDASVPRYVTHRDARHIWPVDEVKQTIFHNYVVFFNDNEFCCVFDKDGWPVENMYGFAYKEYRVVNAAPRQALAESDNARA